MKNMMYAVVATLLAFGTANAADTASSVSIETVDWFVSYDERGANYADKDEFRIGGGPVALYTDSDTDIGISMSFAQPRSEGSTSGISVTGWAEYADSKDYVVGADITADLGMFTLRPRMNWNIDETEFDTDVYAGITWRGFDTYTRMWWDWEADDSFLGTDVGLGWTINMTESLSIRPYAEMPFDSDWEDGTTVAGANVNISF